MGKISTVVSTLLVASTAVLATHHVSKPEAPIIPVFTTFKTQFNFLAWKDSKLAPLYGASIEVLADSVRNKVIVHAKIQGTEAANLMFDFSTGIAQYSVPMLGLCKQESTKHIAPLETLIDMGFGTNV